MVISFLVVFSFGRGATSLRVVLAFGRSSGPEQRWPSFFSFVVLVRGRGGPAFLVRAVRETAPSPTIDLGFPNLG